jgi:membrane protein DedA with SNARE-associated domain
MDAAVGLALVAPLGYLALLLAVPLYGDDPPIRQEVLVISAGYLHAVGVFDWSVAAVICSAGVIAGDVLAFACGRFAVRGLTEELRERRPFTRELRMLGGAVVRARLIPRTRLATLVTAGGRGASLGRFILVDAVAAVAWVWLALRLGDLLGVATRACLPDASTLSEVALLVAVTATAALLRVAGLRSRGHRSIHAPLRT